MIVVFDTASGRIKRVCSAAGQAQSGEGELEADVPYGADETHYVDPISLEVVARPARPSELHKWEGAAWAEDLDGARLYVRSRWNQWVDAQLAAGCTFSGMPMHADDRFFTELTALVVGADLGLRLPPYNIRRRDNQSYQCMTSLELKQIASTVGAHRETAYAASWAAKDASESASTLAGILALLPPS